MKKKPKYFTFSQKKRLFPQKNKQKFSFLIFRKHGTAVFSQTAATSKNSVENQIFHAKLPINNQES